MKINRLSLIFCFLFFSFITTFSESIAQETLPLLIKKIHASTVVIRTYDHDGKIKSQGSGFFIGTEGNILTNYHVIKGSTHTQIKTADGKVYSGNKILREDGESDLILFSVDIRESDVSPLSITTSFPEVGERVLVIGNPLGFEKTVSDGIVSAIREISLKGKVIQLTAPISSGSSGSPVINMKGDVIGIATFQSPKGQNLNFAIPGERIVKFLQGKENTNAKWEVSIKKEDITFAEESYSVGLPFLSQKDFGKALSYFEEAVKKNPHHYQSYFFIGYCNEKFGRLQEAIEAYSRTVFIKHDFAEAHYHLGLVYYRIGRFQESIEAIRYAIFIRPSSASWYNTLGVLYFKLGQFQEAFKALREAIRIKPDYASPHYTLGMTFVNLGDKASALQEYKILMNLDKDLSNKLFSLIYKGE